MKAPTQALIVGLLITIVALQVIAINGTPSLNEIEQKIRHWTMHHGSHFSAKSEIASLRADLNAKLDRIEKELKAKD